MEIRHVADSLSVLPFVAGATVLDVGTGAGLPGLVLAIADAARDYTLIDANAKKARFCEYAADTLGLTNVGEYALWIHALYAQAARDFGPFGVQAGVRLESALTDFTLRTIGSHRVA
jgi:16S rRNA G527 N7-methylase RsmG